MFLEGLTKMTSIKKNTNKNASIKEGYDDDEAASDARIAAAKKASAGFNHGSKVRVNLPGHPTHGKVGHVVKLPGHDGSPFVHVHVPGHKDSQGDEYQAFHHKELTKLHEDKSRNFSKSTKHIIEILASSNPKSTLKEAVYGALSERVDFVLSEFKKVIAANYFAKNNNGKE